MGSERMVKALFASITAVLLLMVATACRPQSSGTDASHKSGDSATIVVSSPTALVMSTVQVVGRPAGTTLPRPTIQPYCQTLAETNKAVCNEFLTYWQQGGGM